MTPRVGAVVFDLFGTLVDAPTPAERTAAAARLARALGCGAGAVDRYLRTTWRERHDGSLASLTALAGDLARRCTGRVDPAGVAARELLGLARARIAPDATVVDTLGRLRADGLRIGAAGAARAWYWAQAALSYVGGSKTPTPQRRRVRGGR